MPEIDVILVEEPAHSGPFGVKGVGEPGMTNMAPAVTNAIGFGIHSLPMTSKKVLEALKGRKLV